MLKHVYHLDLDDEKINSAKYAILPGDPGRVNKIAELSPFLNSWQIANKREYHTYLGYIKEQPVLVTSTGIGGPSTSIAIDELAQLGVETFIRVGTTGALQENINIGDVIITSGAVRLDGASTHYAPIEYPAVSHYRIINALVEAAEELHIPYHVGVPCSSDTFYPGQERVDSFSKYVPRRFQGITEEWKRLHVLNYEMEAATLLTMCSALGLRGGCVEGVIVNRCRGESISAEDLRRGEENATRVGVVAVGRLVEGEMRRR